MSNENPYAPPTAAVADIGTAAASAIPNPPLWNPGAAASWSLLFSPIFGALLHMKNWQALGDPGKAATSKNWAIGTAVFFVLGVVLSVAFPDSKAVDQLSRLGGFVLLIAWYYAIGKSQGSLVQARYGKGYPRRGWAKPLGLAVAAMFGFVVVAVLVGFVAAVVTGAT